MRDYWQLLKIFMSTSLKVDVEYRFNVVLEVLNACLSFGAGLLLIAAMFTQADEVGGWLLPEVLALLGVFMIAENFIEAALYTNLNRLPRYIRTGELDYLLTRPVSSQFMISFRNLNLWSFPSTVLGLGLVVYGMIETNQVSIQNVFLFLLLLLAGLSILYSIWLILLTSAFWLVRVDNIGELFQAFFAAGRFPLTTFPTWLRLILTLVVPILLIVTVPASAVVGRLSWQLALLSLGVAFALLLISHRLWQLGLSRYSSASS
jgi:ABC-2 type transport system permease protein